MDITEISDRMELEKLVTDYATAVDTKNFQDFNNKISPEFWKKLKDKELIHSNAPI